MEWLLILTVLYGINVSKASYLRNTELPAVTSEDFKHRNPLEYDLAKHNLYTGNQLNSRRENHANFVDVRENERLLHPHKYHYRNTLRRLKQVHGKIFTRKRSHLSNIESYRRLRNLRNSGISLRSKMWTNNLNRNDIVKHENTDPRLKSQPQKSRSDVAATSRNYDIADNRAMQRKNSNLAKIVNEKVKRKDLSKTRRSEDKPSTEMLQLPSKLNLLHYIVLFFVFVPIVSIATIVIPAVSYCCNCYKNRKNDDVQHIVETSYQDTGMASIPHIPRGPLLLPPIAAANIKDTPEDIRLPTQVKSFDEMYRTFVSNEIGGAGDGVPKRLKIERWMAQDLALPYKPKSCSKRQRLYNAGYMESVPEESSNFGSIAYSVNQFGTSGSGGEATNDAEAFSELPDRKKQGMKLKNNTRIPKQECRPLIFTNKVATVGKVYYPKHRVPTHVRPLLDRPRRIFAPPSYSMIDLTTQHFS